MRAPHAHAKHADLGAHTRFKKMIDGVFHAQFGGAGVSTHRLNQRKSAAEIASSPLGLCDVLCPIDGAEGAAAPAAPKTICVLSFF